MLDVKVLGELVELDTVNGFYLLDDIYKSVGKPKDKTQVTWIRSRTEGVPSGSIQMVGSKTWANQHMVYAYCSWLCSNFRKVMLEAVTEGNLDKARSISTGVLHK